MLEKFGDSFRVTSAVEFILGQPGLECRPVRRAVLQCERMLDITQAGLRGCAGVCASQADTGVRVVFAQSFQPALRFLSEGFDTALGSELPGHGTSLPLLPGVR